MTFQIVNTKAEAVSLIDFANAQGFSTSKAIKLADSFLVIIYA
jgi:hypothetical protein